MSSEATESGRSRGFGTFIETPSTSETSVAPPPRGHKGSPAGVLSALFLSGFAALLYQIAWLQQFEAVFGELAGVAAIAGYWGGTAVGAAVGGRVADRVRRPVLVYGFLQAGTAVAALATPLLIGAAAAAYVWAFGNLPEPPASSVPGQPLFYLAVAFAVLVIPTALMGAALPLLSRYFVQSNIQVGPRVAILYSTGALGAAAGAVAAVFLLLPMLGVKGTVWAGVLVNAIVSFLAALLARRMVSENAGPVGDRAGSFHAVSAPPGFFSSCLRPMLLLLRGRRIGLAAAFSRQPAWILPLMLVTGGNAFVYLGLWKRMLSHVIGSNLYAFAIMLAAFFAGIALGSLASVRFARTRSIAAGALAVSQAAIALVSIGVYAWMQTLIPDTRSMGSLVLYVVLVMLPATAFMGVTFPLAVRVLSDNGQQVGRVTGRVYAWSTVGGIAGALLAAFYLIPALGLEGSIQLAVRVNLLLALWVVVFVLPRRALSVAVAVALFLLVSLGYQPGRPHAIISSTAFDDAPKSLREMSFTMGRSAAVLLGESDGALELRMNGLPDGSVFVKGAPPLGRVQHWMHALPIAARPDASTLLLIGYGGGVAVEEVPSSIRAIDVVEFEPEVIRANRLMSGLRLVDPLADPRVNVVINDARNALQLTSKRYDIIVSRSSHPLIVGASHLFTREFAELVESRLNDDGVFLQGIGAEFVDGELLRRFAASLLDVYENVRLYSAGEGALVFLASNSPLDLESEILRNGRPLNSNLLHYSYLGLNGAEDFAASLMLDEQGAKAFAGEAPASTDDRNAIASTSRMQAGRLDLVQLTALVAPHDPLLDKDSVLRRRIGDRLDYAYIAARLLSSDQGARAARLADTIEDASTRAVVEALIHAANGDSEEARASMQTALRENPRNMTARFALLEPELTALAIGQASAEAQALASALTGPAAAIARGWAYAATRNLKGLASLDQDLARTRVTDYWFSHATRLRADWRTQVARDSRHAFDALRILDRAIVIQPSFDLYVLRAAAADELGDASAFVETSRYAVRYLNEYLDTAERRTPLSDAELAATFTRLDGWQRRLGQLRGQAGDRVAEVFDQMGALMHRYEVIARSRGKVGE